MEKVLFENLYENPPMVTSVINPDPKDMIRTIKRAIAQGTDGFIFQLERLDNQFKKIETLKELFAETRGFPVMVTNYPYDNNKEQSDEERMAFELQALEAGAACLDVRGDTYDNGAKHELTFSPKAVEKQKELIEKIHFMGGQVIMSMHVWEYLDTEQVLAYGREIESRGADIVKIVHMVNNRAQLAESFVTTEKLHREVSVPVLHLVNGEGCEIHRFYGTAFGSCLTFCVQEFINGSSGAQPMLDKMVQFRKIVDYKYHDGGNQ